MSDTRNSETPANKKAYGKPAIRQVTLQPEEAVLGACKTQSSPGPGVGSCKNPACNALGS